MTLSESSRRCAAVVRLKNKTRYQDCGVSPGLRFLLLTISIWLVLYADRVESQLVVNIRNKGGEVFQERISSNLTEDVIEVEYTNTDGSVITQLIDYAHDVEIYRIILLGEEERGDQEQYQTFCFVTLLNPNEFISTDAMSKLRQKHPGTIRLPDEEKSSEIYEMDLSVDLTKSSIISPHLQRLCGESGLTGATQAFTREIDLKGWTNSKVLNRDVILLTSSVWKLPLTSPAVHTPRPIRCNLFAESSNASELDAANLSAPPSLKPCQCQIQICIPWFPCALKYCRGKDSSSGQNINYRCGIRSCKKCRVFVFQVKRMRSCLWED